MNSLLRQARWAALFAAIATSPACSTTPGPGDAAIVTDGNRTDVVAADREASAPSDTGTTPDVQGTDVQGTDVQAMDAPGADAGIDAARTDVVAAMDAARTDARADAVAMTDARADAVTTSDAARDAAVTSRHASYVPPTLRPTAATRLIVMGDSISDGAGASATTLRYGTLLVANNDTRWPAEMATDLSSRFGTTVTQVNVAIGGSTTASVAGEQLTDLRTRLGAVVRGHSIVVMTTGGNDFTGALRAGRDPTGATLTSAIENLRMMTAFFRDTTRFPDGVSIYVAAVYDPTDGTGSAMGCLGGVTVPRLEAMAETWRDRYMTFGMASNVAIVDALGHFRGHGFHYNDRSNPYYQAGDAVFWFADCVHPNDVGHNEFRRLFFEAIDPTYVVR